VTVSRDGQSAAANFCSEAVILGRWPAVQARSVGSFGGRDVARPRHCATPAKDIYSEYYTNGIELEKLEALKMHNILVTGALKLSAKGQAASTIRKRRPRCRSRRSLPILRR